MISYNTSAVIDSSLVLYLDAANKRSYPGSGTTWADLSPNKYDFTINASAFVAASTGTPAHFNFEGSYGAATRGSDVPNAANGTFMVFTTIKNSTSDWRTLTRGASNDHQVIIAYNSNTLGMYDNDAGGFQSCGFDITSLPNPYTQFNCLIWKLSQSSPYYQFAYNSTNFANTITNAYATFNNGFNIIGAYQGGSQYWGKIAIFMYYNRHLTNDEIIRNFNAHRGRFGV
jgi:hypothetical protein